MFLIGTSFSVSIWGGILDERNETSNDYANMRITDVPYNGLD